MPTVVNFTISELIRLSLFRISSFILSDHTTEIRNYDVIDKHQTARNDPSGLGLNCLKRKVLKKKYSYGKVCQIIKTDICTCSSLAENWWQLE